MLEDFLGVALIGQDNPHNIIYVYHSQDLQGRM